MNELYRDVLRDVRPIPMTSITRKAAVIETRRAVLIVQALLGAADDTRHGGGKLIGMIRSVLMAIRVHHGVQHG